MLVLDASIGEGGPEILRSTLHVAMSLSMVTRRPFKLDRFRAARAGAGLAKSDLSAIRAAAAICNAEVGGNTIGSTAFTISRMVSLAASRASETPPPIPRWLFTIPAFTINCSTFAR